MSLLKRLPVFSGRLFATAVLIFFSVDVHAQSTQIWTDYDVVYPFGNVYSFDVETSYQTVLSRESKWRALSLTPTLERAITQNVDVMLGLPLSYTVQTDTFNSAEIRISMGSRFHFTPNRRILTRLLVRYEPRFVYQQDFDDWQKSNRLRVRGETIIPINRKSYFDDKLWYGLLDYELFFVKDNTIEERYANRSRARIGLGYRFNYSLRMELIFTVQESKNTLTEGSEERSDIIRFRIKHFLNRTKPAVTDGSGN
jgi:Protein of unknown function (DUF2490)